MVVNRSDLSVSLLSDLSQFLSPYQLQYLAASDDWASLPIDPSAAGTRAAATFLVRSVWKKFQDEIDEEAADSEAYRLFHEANDFCLNGFDSVIDHTSLGPADSEIIGQIKQELWMFFNYEGYPLFSHAANQQTPDLYVDVDFGPGAAPGASRTSFLHKLGSSQLTASSLSIVEDYYKWCEGSVTRTSNELCRSMTKGRAAVEENPTPLVAVPKTSKVSRLVKTEPLLNMFFQKGIQSVMERRLRSLWHIDLATQPSRNARLACLGSIDGSYATIDLTQCSDYISCSLVKELVDRTTYYVFNRYRSPDAMVNGEKVNLGMMATMGNAFCFPLQTVILSAVVRAVYKCLGLPLKRKRDTYHLAGDTILQRHEPMNWGVFGDDIVVLNEAYPTVIRVLRALRLKPNESKSFWTGNFRESCGSDWMNGENVRGVYLKTLKTPQNLAIAFNSLTEWSVRTGIPLTSTLRHIFMARADWPLVPLWENPDAGIRLPLTVVKDLIRLDRSEEYVGSYLYRKWVGKPITYDRSRGYHNPFAVLLSASLGKLRRGLEIVRPKVLRYGVVLGVAPSWDIIPGDSLFVREFRMGLLRNVIG